ncbi:MAG: dihydroorotate dehydrogenase electron transfer subunit [Candidatus Hermodarchaeota archaeon]
MSLTKPFTTKITQIVEWNEHVRTFFIEYPEFLSSFRSGQFAMVWIPGIDEIPLGISHVDPLGFTVELVGPGTQGLFNMNVGAYLGVRGPLGNGFSINPESELFLVVAGGIGFAPLRVLVFDLLKEKKPVLLFHGARTESQLLYYPEFMNLAEENPHLDFFVATDDGSCGEHCLITKSYERVVQEMKESNQLQAETPITIFGVGPELMLKSLYDSSLTFFNNPKVQMSLTDRYMKCGTGVCGSCNVDNDKLGIRLCKEGPVLNKKQLSQISTFGKYGRNASGQLYEF